MIGAVAGWLGDDSREDEVAAVRRFGGFPAIGLG